MLFLLLLLWPGVNVTKLFINVIYEYNNKLVYVSDKIFKHSLTNTSILQKFVNYGQKKFYNIGSCTIKDYK